MGKKKHLTPFYLCWEINKIGLLSTILVKLLDYGFRIFFVTITTRVLLNNLQKNNIEYIKNFLILSTVLFFFYFLFKMTFENFIQPISNQCFTEVLNQMIFKKIGEMDLVCYENNEFYTKIVKVNTNCKQALHQYMQDIGELIGAILGSISILYIIIQIDYLTIVFIVVPCLATLLIGKRLSDYRFNLNQDNMSATKKKEYVKRIAYLKQYAMEIRLFNIFQIMQDYYEEATQVIDENIKKHGVKIGTLDFIISSLNLIIPLFGTSIYCIYSIMLSKTMLIGDYTIMAIALVDLSQIVNTIVNKRISLKERKLYMEQLEEFMNYEPKITNTQGKILPAPCQIIELEDVSFSYDGKIEVLKHINVKINKGEKIALVGFNGSGKSTLIKQLLRLYEPTNGRIKYNNEDIRKFDVQAYRSRFGTVFQDSVPYAMSISENVFMRDINKEDQAQVIQALKVSGIYEEIKKLDKNIDTIVTKEFDGDGIELSGGQLQKILISRVFVSNCDVVILDEPSSALDPFAETQLYERIFDVCKNKTVIFVSHRLSSTINADKIIMLDAGEVCEIGSHEELMQLNGKYANMFRKQAAAYVDEVL